MTLMIIITLMIILTYCNIQYARSSRRVLGKYIEFTTSNRVFEKLRSNQLSDQLFGKVERLTSNLEFVVISRQLTRIVMMVVCCLIIALLFGADINSLVSILYCGTALFNTIVMTPIVKGASIELDELSQII